MRWIKWKRRNQNHTSPKLMEWSTVSSPSVKREITLKICNANDKILGNQIITRNGQVMQSVVFFFLLFPIWEMFAQVPLSLFIVIIKTCANCFMWSYWGIVATKSRSSQLNPIMYEFAMKQNATRIMPAIFAIVNTCPQLAHTWLMVTHTILSILHAKMQTIQKLQKRNAHFMFSYFEKCLRWVQFNAMFCSCCIEP